MQTFAYPATIEVDEAGFYLVTFPDVPHCATDGETFEEALEEASDALKEAIAQCIDDDMEIPLPSPYKKNQSMVYLSLQMSAKAALYLAMREADIGVSEFAHQLKMAENEIRQMLDPRMTIPLPRLEESLAALGKRLVVHVEAA